MKEEASQFGTTPFSYDILDAEAAKISNLMMAVNKKCAGAQCDKVARELFDWAEQMRAAGHYEQADFLYLNAVGILQKNNQLRYPVTFAGLREYAMLLLEQSGNAPDNVTELDILAPTQQKRAA